MYNDFLEEGCFDHATDGKWDRHEESPSRDPTVPSTRPKPDIFVGFRPITILSSSRFDSLGKEFRSTMVPASTEAEDDGIAFPFLIMEAKGPSGKLGASPQLRQVVNNASNALYILWKFFSYAGEEKDFFEYIRVFTMGGTYDRLIIRMHYAVLEENRNDWVTRDYPLRYRYEVLVKPTTEAANCRLLIQNVLVNALAYAESTMRPKIQTAVNKVLDKFDEDRGGVLQSLHVSISSITLWISTPDIVLTVAG